MGIQLTGEIVSSICSIAERPTAAGILSGAFLASCPLDDIRRPVKKIFCSPTHPIDFGMMWKRSEGLPMTWGGPWTFVLKVDQDLNCEAGRALFSVPGCTYGVPIQGWIAPGEQAMVPGICWMQYTSWTTLLVVGIKLEEQTNPF